MAAVDLECYDYAPHTAAPIRATEGTVESRLPPRVEVRRRAPLEIPHVMLLMDDREDRVLGPLEAGRAALPPVYDFPLMLQGGRLRGWQVPAARAEGVCRRWRPWSRIAGPGRRGWPLPWETGTTPWARPNVCGRS